MYFALLNNVNRSSQMYIVIRIGGGVYFAKKKKRNTVVRSTDVPYNTFDI